MTEALPTHPYSPASQLAERLVASWVSKGLEHVVLAPGSRSQALALAAAAAERRGEIHLHVFIDERSAGFFALGLARESGRPAVVITTSGSAVGNLLPAAMEAWHSGVPMLLVTADRPATLRARRANQTTRQLAALAGFVVAARDVPPPAAEPEHADQVDAEATELAQWAWLQATTGPVHLNLQVVEPLSGGTVPTGVSVTVPAVVGGEVTAVPPVDTQAQPGRPGVVAPVIGDVARSSLELDAETRTLVIAGVGAGPSAEAAARELGAPLIAEVVSGAHFGPQLVVPYGQLLALDEFSASVQRAVVFGTPTLSRAIAALLARPEVEVIVVDSAGGDRFVPAGRQAARHISAVAVARVSALASSQDGSEGPGDAAPVSEWSRAWLLAGRELVERQHAETAAPPPLNSGLGRDGHVTDFAAQRAYLARELGALNQPITRASLVAAVWRASWPHDRLVFASSRLVREADATLVGKKITVYANRGLAGIDGSIATARGIAAAHRAAGGTGLVRLIVGDLAFLHDVGSLAISPGEDPGRLQVIVGNDGGGSIFDALEVAQSAHPADFDRVLFTPQRVDLSALAQAYGWAYRKPSTVADLDQVLTDPDPRPTLVEVLLER